MASIYEIVTQEILKKLDEGTVPWRQPWKSGDMPKNFISKRYYGGINAFLLWCTAYHSPYWLTFNQCVKAGGSVRKGEKSQLVVFWKKFPAVKVKNEDGEEEEKSGFMLRYFKVFNVEQCDGLNVEEEPARAISKLDECEKIFEGYKDRPQTKWGMLGASYCPTRDIVYMPNRADFSSSEAVYATLFHELTHSTGHEKRLSRKLTTKTDSLDSYSKEELVAEFGSAFLCGHAGIAPTILENAASYISHWKEKLQQDSRLLTSAASQAQKATNFILGIPSPSEK